MAGRREEQRSPSSAEPKAGGRLPLRYSLRSIGARPVRTLLTVAVVALVVLAVTLMLSLVSGIRRTLVATGSPDNLIVLRKGATNDGSSMIPIEAYQAVRYFAGIATDQPSGEPLVSPELVVQPFFHTAAGGRENVLVRGIRPVAFAVHENVRVGEGRMARPSSGEAMVGRGLLARYGDIGPGRELRFGRRTWTVVGILDSGGSAFESEVWVDVHDLWNDANRSAYSGLRLKAAPGADRDALVRRIESDGRWALEARPEVDYYEEQGETANFLYGLTLILAAVMGLGATFG
ncbi:MAG: ABC transporter permease, partial [Candidatus Binatia bacterium]